MTDADPRLDRVPSDFPLLLRNGLGDHVEAWLIAAFDHVGRNRGAVYLDLFWDRRRVEVFNFNHVVIADFFADGELNAEFSFEMFPRTFGIHFFSTNTNGRDIRVFQIVTATSSNELAKFRHEFVGRRLGSR